MTRYVLIVLSAWLACFATDVQAQSVRPVDKALIVASVKGDTAAVRVAMAQGANVNTAIDPDDPLPLSPLVGAVGSGSVEIRRILLAAGADPRKFEGSAMKTAIALLDAPAVRDFLGVMGPPDEEDAMLVNALVARPSVAGAALMRRMLRTEAGLEQLTAPEAMAFFAEYLAGRFSEDTDDPALDILDALVSAGAPLNNLMEVGDVEMGVVERAAHSGDQFMVEALRARGAVMPEGWSEQTLTIATLVGAARAGNERGLVKLLDAGSDPNTSAPNGEFALPLAVDFGRATIVELMLANGADPEKYGADHASALHLAVRNDRADIAAMLLAKGAAPGKKDELRAWPLRAAVRAGSENSVKLLLQAGANINETDGRGRSVLHDFTLGEGAIDGASSNVRPLEPYQLAVLPVLGANAFNFGARDARGRTPIGTVMTGALSGLSIAQDFAAAGSPVTQDFLLEAVRKGQLAAVRWVISRDVALGKDSTVLDAAFDRIKHQPELAIALLQAGAPLPQAEQAREALLVQAAEAGVDEAVGLLLARGIPATSRTSINTGLGAAVRSGSLKTVTLLVERGATPVPATVQGGSVVHELLADDAEAARRGRPPLLGPAQQIAVAALLDVGFDIDSRDAGGRTVEQLAGTQPASLARWHAAIAIAGKQQGELHQAVRQNDLPKLIAAIDAGQDLNALDSLQRSPLTLALQLLRHAAVERLLAAGAEMTIAPRNAYQQADISFAGDERLAPAFILRLTAARLLDLTEVTSVAQAEAGLAAFKANGAPSLRSNWRIDCQICKSPFSLADEAYNKSLLIRAWRKPTANGVLFGVRKNDLGPSTFSMPPVSPHVRGYHTIEIEFDVDGKVEIPGCNFTSLNALCYPEVEIENPNTPSEFLIRTRDGPKPLPGAMLDVIQNGQHYPISPGEKRVFDRSAGDISVELQRVKTKIFTFWIPVRFGRGPDIVVAQEDLGAGARALAYARIAALRAELKSVQDQAAPGSALRARTLATAIRVHSLETYRVRYAAVVLELLKIRARDLANMEMRVIELRNAVFAQSQLSADEIDLLITRANGLIAIASSAERPALEQIRDGLQRARNSVAQSHVAVRVLRENFYSNVDAIIRDYQGLILEYAQYARPAEYQGMLDSADRAKILERVDARDVLIDNNMAGSSGAALRAAFGLPNPSARRLM